LILIPTLQKACEEKRMEKQAIAAASFQHLFCGRDVAKSNLIGVVEVDFFGRQVNGILPNLSCTAQFLRISGYP